MTGAPFDVRTRRDGEHAPVDPETFFDSVLRDALRAREAELVPGIAFIEPRPLLVEIGDAHWTLRADRGVVEIRRGVHDPVAHVRLGVDQLDDLVTDQQTVMSLWAGNALDQRSGQVGHLLDWWLVLRAALDGTTIYTPGSIAFTDERGAPLELTRTFRPDDDPAAMRAFLASAGFLHIAGVFSDSEMAAVSADMDAAAPRYTEGDGRSWWARTADGATRLVRMQGFDRESTTTAALLDDERFQCLARIPATGHEFGKKRAQNRIEALFKPIGVTEGISDIPWHKDCGIGRHSYDCCGLTVGISVTGADAESGQLWALAGSHRALIWSGVMQPDVDLPQVPLPTGRGDVTLHLSCTMHMAQPPVARERRVMYSGFSLPPLHDVDTGAVARERSRLGDVREQAPLTVLDRHFKS